MMIREVRLITKKWISRLDLTNWRIHVQWGTKEDLRGLDGGTTWYPEQRYAEIILARSQVDHEHTIVHELLHILLQGHVDCRADEYDAQFEAGLNVIAEALIRGGVPGSAF